MFDILQAEMLVQQSLEDLGVPLSEVTFTVLDLETTGSSAASSAITEVGAVKVRRGEVVGTFHTLVDPGTPVPSFVRLLTGISDEMLIEAPRIDAVLPSLLEFLGDSVLVAHNARFDVGFLNAALDSAGYEPLVNRVVDTAALARKVLAGEVPNNKLSTLASYLRCPHVPSHRAYADAIATTDVLHHLIERVAGYGVTTLEHLLAVTRSRLDGTFAKVILADGLPHGIGVYRFVGARGNTLYIGKATDIRRRVRSYFYGDPRRKIRDLLRETQSIEVQQHASMLEAEIAEACAIATELPPYNSSGKSHAAWYVRIVTRTKVPKVAAARGRRPDGSIYLGPFSARIARALIDTFRDALALHRCSRPERCRGCAFGEMGTCAGTDPAAHRREMAALAASVLTEPDRILDPLVQRMRKLASQERFEEAAELRERAAVLERLLHRDLETRALVDAGDVVVASGGRAILLRAGRVSAATDTTDRDDDEVVAPLMTAAGAQEGMTFAGVEEHRQAPIISAWLRRAPDVRLLHATGIWAHPAAARPAWRFRPVHTEAATSTRRSRARAERPESIASAAI